jgi:hypothetical protein
MINLDLSKTLNRLPNYVHDVSTATCVFCPYGADVKVGDRIVAFDERTAFGRCQRERLVEVTAVKGFRSTGRIITLDLKIAKEDEIARIAEDSELTVEMLFEHRIGNATYLEGRSPVVVYFKPCNIDDTIGSQFKQRKRRYPRLIRSAR